MPDGTVDLVRTMGEQRGIGEVRLVDLGRGLKGQWLGLHTEQERYVVTYHMNLALLVWHTRTNTWFEVRAGRSKRATQLRDIRPDYASPPVLLNKVPMQLLANGGTDALPPGTKGKVVRHIITRQLEGATP